MYVLYCTYVFRTWFDVAPSMYIPSDKRADGPCDRTMDSRLENNVIPTALRPFFFRSSGKSPVKLLFLLSIGPLFSGHWAYFFDTVRVGSASRARQRAPSPREKNEFSQGVGLLSRARLTSSCSLTTPPGPEGSMLPPTEVQRPNFCDNVVYFSFGAPVLKPHFRD